MQGRMETDKAEGRLSRCTTASKAADGKGFYVNAQDSEMIKEQHLRKVEESLTDAIAAAEVAGISNDELKGMLEALLEVDK